jgi:hypothetical protein
LAQVVADRNLPAKRIAAPVQSELVEIVRARLHQNGYADIRKANGISYPLLVAKIGKAHENSIDAIPVPAQEVSAFLRVCPGFHGTKLCIPIGQPYGLDREFREQFCQIAACFSDQNIRKKVAISKNDAKSGHGTSPYLLEILKLICILFSNQITRNDLLFRFMSRTCSEKLIRLIDRETRDNDGGLKGGGAKFTGTNGRNSVGASVESRDHDAGTPCRLDRSQSAKRHCVVSGDDALDTLVSLQDRLRLLESLRLGPVG